MRHKPDSILVDALVEHLPTTQAILGKFRKVDTTIIEDIRAVKKPSDFSKAKKTWLITAQHGSALKPCQGMGAGHLCCGYWIIDLISNCPMDCSYCILQHYLENNPLLTIYANVDEILTKASLFISGHRDRKFRIGTGELSDSLALDDITGFSKRLIEYFRHQPNVTLELKTKTANIDHLLKLDHNGRVVIGWSVNPQRIIGQEETGTASLANRFDAARRAVNAGYKAGFHFDPIIYPHTQEVPVRSVHASGLGVGVYSEDWEGEYKPLTEVIKTFPHEMIAWISLGTLRFPRQMKEIVMRRFPRSRIFYNSLVPVNGKVRYFRPTREVMYKKMLEWLGPLREKTYLCMETKAVWQNVLPGCRTGAIAC